MSSRPKIRNVEDVWCWMNTWGELDDRGYAVHSGEYRGYRDAIADLLRVLDSAGVSASDEAWERWTSRDPSQSGAGV